MKVAFRVDAGLKIGTGHVMRCLTLAGEMKKRHVSVVFICRDHKDHLCDLISSKGFKVYKLSLDQEFRAENPPIKKRKPSKQSEYADWLGVSQNTDAKQTKDALQNDSPYDLLVVDHYAMDSSWETEIRGIAKKIMAIDDLADRKHDCDLLLDQNYFQRPHIRYHGLLPEHCQSLLGPQFALVRPEFRQAKKFCRMRSIGIGRVLVYFGGNDPNNLTGIALEALNCPELQHLFVEVVIGTNNSYQKDLEKLAKKRQRTRMSIQPEAFTELMLRADLCVGAGGTTTWERLCLGLPSIVITVARNQEPFIKELNHTGYLTWIGNEKRISIADIRRKLIDEVARLNNTKLCTSLQNPVDGYGALRVIEKLVPSSKQELILRKTTMKEMEQYFIWANDPFVRENSFQQKPIAWEEHVQWFTRKFHSENTKMWILETSQGLTVGQIRATIDEGTANIGYSLDSIVRGRGWGLKLLEMGIEKIKNNANCRVIQGKVKKENLLSRKLFLKLGFNENIENNIILFTKEKK